MSDKYNRFNKSDISDITTVFKKYMVDLINKETKTPLFDLTFACVEIGSLGEILEKIYAKHIEDESDDEDDERPKDDDYIDIGNITLTLKETDKKNKKKK